jgi:hypothetical protein
LSISWYRRNEKDMRNIGVELIKALGEAAKKQE